MADVIEFMKSNWNLVSSNPFEFAIFGTLTLGLGWLASQKFNERELKHLSSQVVAHRDEAARLARQLDELKELSGLNPQDSVETLKKRISELEKHPFLGEWSELPDA